MREKRRARLELAVHERRADEDLVRRRRIDRPVADAPVRVHRQTVERAPLERDHLAAARVPLRLVVLAPDEVPADLLQPAWFDRRDLAGKEAAGLHQLAGGDPAAGFLRPRPGMDPELDAACAGIARFRLVLDADVAEQPGEQRAVDGTVSLGPLRM